MYNESSQTIEQGTTRTPEPLAGSFLYLIVLSLMLASSVFTRQVNIDGDRYYIIMFLIQLVTIGLPPIAYLILGKKDIKYSLRLNKASVAEIFLSIGMALFGYGVIIFINLVWILFLSRFGTPRPASLPAIENARQFWMAIAVVAAVPALLEEFLFRGVIQRGYESFGKITHIILTGILFALLHLSIVSVPAIILIGILLCYIAYRSNSIWASIAYHFTNNAIAVTLSYISSIISKLFPAEFDGMSPNFADVPPEALRMAVAVWGFIGFFALLFFGACLAGFHIATRDKQRIRPVDTSINAGGKFILLIPAILAVLVIIVLLVFEAIEMVNPTPIM